jgi:DNA-directed RNA polymerase subunit RPC12/RpoP
MFITPESPKICPRCRQKISFILLKEVKTRIQRYNGGFFDDEISEEAFYCCPLCGKEVCNPKDKDGRRPTEIVKEIWKSLKNL